MTIKLANFATTARAAMADKERGATALEYVGMLVVAAIVVGAVFLAIRNANVGGAVSDAVSTILGG